MAGEQDDQNKKDDASAASAPTEVVEDYLNLGPFFKRHQDHILDKLEECDEIAEKAKKNQDMIFFAESLPIIDGLIQVGTKRDEYRSALAWVKNKKDWGEEVEPAHVLSALTFVYVTKKGEEMAARGERKREVWDRISRRVKKLEPEP